MDTKIRNLEKELAERKDMGKKGVNNYSSQGSPVGIIGGVPCEQGNERGNRSELVEISIVIQEGCKRLQEELTEKCCAIIGMTLQEEEHREKYLPEKVKQLEEECQRLRDAIKEREGETIKSNQKLEAGREEKVKPEQSYSQTQNENDQVQKRHQNLIAKSLEAKRTIKGLKFYLEEERTKTKEQARELEQLKDAKRRAKLYHKNFKQMQRKKEEDTKKENLKQKELFQKEIKGLRSQLESELKIHMATTEELKKELREVHKLHKQAQNKLENMQSLRSSSTLSAIGPEEG